MLWLQVLCPGLLEYSPLSPGGFSCLYLNYNIQVYCKPVQPTSATLGTWSNDAYVDNVDTTVSPVPTTVINNADW